MLKVLVLISLLHLSVFQSNSTTKQLISGCPDPTSIEKVGKTSSSYTYKWTASASTYRVWYVRLDDNSFSGYSYTSSNSYTFGSLPSGRYAFYCQIVCEEPSGYIGIEDVIGA